MNGGPSRWRARASRLALPGLLGVLVVALGLLRTTTPFEMLEARTLDWRARLLPRPAPASPRIVLLLLDQASLDHFERVEGLTWPWPRDVYGAVVELCRAAGARLVVFDVLFSSSSPCDPAFDDAFGQALTTFPRVVLAASFGAESAPGAPSPGAADLAPYAVAVTGTGEPAAQRARVAHLPVPPLLRAVQWIGDAHAEPDADGVFRRVSLLTRLGERFVPSLPLAVALAVSGQRSVGLERGRAAFGPFHVPLDRGSMLVRYYGAPGQGRERERSFRSFPLGNAILAQRSLERGETPALDLQELKDAIVFVGFSAPGLLDNRPTPIASVMPGVEINATAVANILGRDHLLRAPAVASLGLLLAGVLLAALIVLRVHKALLSLVASVVALAAVAGAATAAFGRGVWIDLAAPLVGVVASYAATSAYSFATEGRQRRFLRRVLSLYNSDAVIEEIVRDPGRLALGGEKREITVLFSDIAGFTSLSESLAPEELVSLMKDYLDAMTRVILDEAGTVDKYIGDAIMAFWGAPLPASDHAVRACRAALGNQRRLAELRSSLAARGLPPVHARIGLNSGEASVGNFGSTARFSYTAIGDNVNLASRLEGANKAYHTAVMIAESTYEEAKHAVEVRELDCIRVKGKEKAIRIYELVALKGERSDADLAPFRRFEEGLGLYRARRWDEAIAVFEEVIRARGHDGPSEVLVERCRRLAAQPPPPDWDGTHTMTEK